VGSGAGNAAVRIRDGERMSELSLADRVNSAALALRARDPRVDAGGFLGVVLGSGLGPAADLLDDAVDIPFAELPHFHVPTVAGHGGSVRVGEVEGATVVVLRGRVHAYEGHPMADVVHGVRTLVAAGARAMLLTNAAGGVRPDLPVGGLMVIEDHLNLSGQNPLVGIESTELGPRFPDMTRAWDRRLTAALLGAAKTAGVPVSKGVYAGLLGPSYETPAEIRMVRALGGDAVGMSTVAEAIAIAQMGCRVAGISIISNKAAGTGHPDEVLEHSHVADVAAEAGIRVAQVLRALLRDRDGWWERA
jgi:purine-nucleoside phosphorylase